MTSCDKRYRHARPLTLRDHECLLLRGIPATTLHSGYDFNSLHLGHSFALGLCLGLCFYQGVRFKWGLLQQWSAHYEWQSDCYATSDDSAPPRIQQPRNSRLSGSAPGRSSCPVASAGGGSFSGGDVSTHTVSARCEAFVPA